MTPNQIRETANRLEVLCDPPRMRKLDQRTRRSESGEGLRDSVEMGGRRRGGCV